MKKSISYKLRCFSWLIQTPCNQELFLNWIKNTRCQPFWEMLWWSMSLKDYWVRWLFLFLFLTNTLEHFFLQIVFYFSISSKYLFWRCLHWWQKWWNASFEIVFGNNVLFINVMASFRPRHHCEFQENYSRRYVAYIFLFLAFESWYESVLTQAAWPPLMYHIVIWKNLWHKTTERIKVMRNSLLMK